MNPVHNILVIVDPTALDHPAVEKAALLAERFSARIDLFVCDTKASWNIRHAQQASENSRGEASDALKPMVEGAAEQLRRRGIEVTTEIVKADPLALALLNRVKHTCADLVVKDTHHDAGARRTFLTNTDWELIRCCPVPLLLTKSRRWSGNPCVCAAVDPGHHDDKPALLDHCILQVASNFASSLQGQLHVLHAYISIARLAAVVNGASLKGAAAIADPVVDEITRKLNELTALVSDYGVRMENVHLEIGATGDVLCRLA
jgi:universal stress protein E